MTRHGIIALYATLRYATLRHAMLFYAMLCYAMLRYATLCYAMLRYATLRYAMQGVKWQNNCMWWDMGAYNESSRVDSFCNMFTYSNWTSLFTRELMDDLNHFTVRFRI